MKTQTVLLGLGFGAAVAAAIYFATRKPAGTAAPQNPSFNNGDAGSRGGSSASSYNNIQAQSNEPVKRILDVVQDVQRTANTYTPQRTVDVIYTAPVIASQQPVRDNTVVPPRTDTTVKEIVKAPTKTIQGLFGTHG